MPEWSEYDGLANAARMAVVFSKDVGSSKFQVDNHTALRAPYVEAAILVRPSKCEVL